MQKWKIPLYKIFHDESDEKLVQKVISRGMDWAIGPEIAEFEKLLANYVGTSYCVTFNSGTSALHAAILALKIKKEIIVPSFSFIATSNSVLMANTRPVFADIEKETFGIDPKHVKKLISKKTGSIIPVHYSGMSCKIDEILQLSKIQKIPVIEDCAESLGATNNGKKVGTFGNASVFSFAPNKIISTGEGGAVLTNSKKLYEKLKLIRSHGRKETQSYFSSIENPKYVSMGYNWRLSSISAALGISQIQKIEKIIFLRQEKANLFNQSLKNVDEIQTITIPKNYNHVYQMYPILLPSKKIRNKLMKFLFEKGIMTKIFFNPIHKSHFYKKQILIKEPKLPITNLISEKILNLPIFPSLKKEELCYITDSIKEFFEKSNYLK